MKEHANMKLSGAMREVLDRLAGGARLRRISGSSWSTDEPPVNGHRPAWCCTSSTVAALLRRGLIQAAGQEGRPWLEQEFVLKGQDGIASGTTVEIMDPLTSMNCSLHEAIQKEAYLISMQRQDGDAHGHWLEAERRLLGRLSGGGA